MTPTFRGRSRRARYRSLRHNVNKTSPIKYRAAEKARASDLGQYVSLGPTSSAFKLEILTPLCRDAEVVHHTREEIFRWRACVALTGGNIKALCKSSISKIAEHGGSRNQPAVEFEATVEEVIRKVRNQKKAWYTELSTHWNIAAEIDGCHIAAMRRTAHPSVSPDSLEMKIHKDLAEEMTDLSYEYGELAPYINKEQVKLELRLVLHAPAPSMVKNWDIMQFVRFNQAPSTFELHLDDLLQSPDVLKAFDAAADEASQWETHVARMRHLAERRSESPPTLTRFPDPDCKLMKDFADAIVGIFDKTIVKWWMWQAELRDIGVRMSQRPLEACISVDFQAGEKERLMMGLPGIPSSRMRL
ncbi:MAG: hypothetical protein Q9218_003251 [Villophora microphyllina]